MLQSEWSLLVLRIPNLPAPSIAFLVLWQSLSSCLPFLFLWFSLCGPMGRQIIFFSFLFVYSSGDQLATQNQRKLFASHSPGQILVCVLAIWYYGQIFMSWTIPSRSLLAACRVKSCALFVLACCILLLCDLRFHLYNLHLPFCGIFSIFALT